jgi:hypothetical protein
MNIKFSDYDLTDFNLREGEIAGDKVFLICPPHIGTKWTKSNLHLRSSIWNEDGDLISASFKKFFNWGEQPDLSYTPFSPTANGGITAMEKMDGSTLIISRYKGELIARTRGTMDATQLDNGWEIADLIEKYPKVFDNLYLNDGYSIICEWVTPNNRIVIEYTEPDIILIGMINHKDYTLTDQKVLDLIGQELEVKRPRFFEYKSIKEMLADVPTWKKTEGICVYCNRGQDIRKLKADYYLKLHRLKSEMGSYERVVDFYFENDQPTYPEFYTIVCETLDYEIAETIRGQMSKIVDCMKEVTKIIDFMKKYVEENKHKTRKEFAIETQQKWGTTNRASFVFCLLDGKELNKEQTKKLLYQVGKKESKL